MVVIAPPRQQEALEAATPATEAAGASHERPEERKVYRNLYLMGRPRAKDFVRYVRENGVNPPGRAELAHAWDGAREVIRELEISEAGAPNDPSIRTIEPGEYESLLIEFLQDPLVRNGFNTVPTEVAMVDLDKVVVYQKHIDLDFVDRLARQLGPAPSDEEIFRFCLLHDHTQPPVTWSRVESDKYVFVSPSNDLRYLGPMPMDPQNVHDYTPPGDLVGVVGIGVGFGSNFVNAVLADGRLILHNGSHRTYALRKLGITHVPCIVQHVTTRAELELVAPSRVRRHPDQYLKAPRPSMLKDYFDPRLHTVMEVKRRVHTVTVKFQVEQAWVPAL